MNVLECYRANWPRVGGLLAMAGAGALVLIHRRMSAPQALSAANMLALLAHQSPNGDPRRSLSGATGRIPNSSPLD
jgi:hypothetical protein